MIGRGIAGIVRRIEEINEIAANIAGVTQAAAETGGSAGEVLSAARSLSREANDLKSVVGRFLGDVRAA